MKKYMGSIVCGLLLAMGCSGFSEQGGASVPAGAGADAKAGPKPVGEKTKKPRAPVSAVD